MPLPGDGDSRPGSDESQPPHDRVSHHPGNSASGAGRQRRVRRRLWKADHGSTSLGSETGLLGAAAFLLAIVSWFTIVIGGEHIPGIRQFTAF
jgi:hypothetical protein